MKSFGLDARGQNSACLYTNAEAVLLDRRTGREIWNCAVHGTDRLTPRVRGAANVPGAGAIITASSLASMSVADFQDALQQLAELSSNVVADELRSALRDVRQLRTVLRFISLSVYGLPGTQKLTEACRKPKYRQADSTIFRHCPSPADARNFLAQPRRPPCPSPARCSSSAPSRPRRFPSARRTRPRVPRRRPRRSSRRASSRCRMARAPGRAIRSPMRRGASGSSGRTATTSAASTRRPVSSSRYEIDPGTNPHNLVVDKGMVWFTGNRNNRLVKLDPAHGEAHDVHDPRFVGARSAHDDLRREERHRVVHGAERRRRRPLRARHAASSASGRRAPTRAPTASCSTRRAARGSTSSAPTPSARSTRRPFELKRFTLPSDRTRPRRIAITSDDQLWYGDYTRGFLGHLDPKTGRTRGVGAACRARRRSRTAWPPMTATSSGSRRTAARTCGPPSSPSIRARRSSSPRSRWARRARIPSGT